jgi:hypothetical protein
MLASNPFASVLDARGTSVSTTIAIRVLLIRANSARPAAAKLSSL